ncbi:MAG: hypothetical protein ACLFQB_15515 [Chitinispirillaceae bacterium]
MMALTDFAHVYAALHDAGINRVIRLLMKQRPSLFNYGTENIRRNPDLLCEPLNVHPRVTRFITVLDPVPVMGSESLGLDFCVQLTHVSFLRGRPNPGVRYGFPEQLSSVRIRISTSPWT